MEKILANDYCSLDTISIPILLLITLPTSVVTHTIFLFINSYLRTQTDLLSGPLWPGPDWNVIHENYKYRRLISI